MSWALGFDSNWNRDIGYGVPSHCDHPGCAKKIHRGLSYVCGSDPYGGEHGCGLYFCSDHLGYRKPQGADSVVQNCSRCLAYRKPYRPKPDHPDWVEWKETDPSWAEWRAERDAQEADRG